MRTVILGALLLSLSPACGDQLVQYDLADGGGNPAVPTVIATSPLDMASNVGVNRRVTATFSEPMNPATLTATTFTVRQGTNAVAGTVTYSGTTATFTATNPLSISLPYTGRITTGAADPQGQKLASDHVWTFSTGACGQAAVALRSAGSFAVLAGASVASTGPTSLTGDIGVSPGTAIDGFPPGNFTGTEHSANTTSAAAIADLTTAYNDAAGRTLCPTTVAGNLGGQTLTPGLYKSTDSLEVSSGDLTLDGQGDSDAVFIFQMASTLTTTAGRQVILIGDANAANVFWQVGTSAALGTTSAFNGTIMADQAITMDTGATLNGRALARITEITLDSNTIVRP